MSTKSLVDDIVPYASGWSRPKILALVQKGQDRLFEYDSPYTVYLDSSNEGMEPYLKTVSGTCKYDIVAANLSSGAISKTIGSATYSVRAKKVLKVFQDSMTMDYGKRFLGKPQLYTWQNPYTTRNDRLQFNEVPVDSWPALTGTNAYLIFKEDPGTNDARYFIRFTWEPPRLTSEFIPLAVPEEYEEALEDYVVGKIQYRSYGKINDRMARFEQEWVPRWRSDSSSGARSTNKMTRPRFC